MGAQLSVGAEKRILKVQPAAGYPLEEGCYLRGNDYSPVAVVVILRWRREETPAEMERLVRIAAESGAALAGTLQTENIGLEKVICNVVANPNIRYLIVCGPESEGHLVGQTIAALMKDGIDDEKRIIGSEAPTPFLYNIAPQFVDRFRQQLSLVDLTNEGSGEVLREAVCACYQEAPTPFRGYQLSDPGAYSEPPLAGRITWRVTRPFDLPRSEEERDHVEKARGLMERIRSSVARKRNA